LVQVPARNTPYATPEPTQFSAFIRWGTGDSYSIYLAHYPGQQLIDTVMLEAIAPLLSDTVFLGLVLVICFLFAHYFKRPNGNLHITLALLLRGQNKSASRAESYTVPQVGLAIKPCQILRDEIAPHRFRIGINQPLCDRTGYRAAANRSTVHRAHTAEA